MPENTPISPHLLHLWTKSAFAPLLLRTFPVNIISPLIQSSHIIRSMYVIAVSFIGLRIKNDTLSAVVNHLNSTFS